VYARAGRAAGLSASAEDLHAAFRRAWPAYVARAGDRAMTFGRDDRQTRAWWRTLVDEILDEVGFEGDRAACFDAFFAAFEAPEAWRVYDDVFPTLRAVRGRGLGVGVLSNWDYRLPPLLERLGLSDLAPLVVSAFEGVAKPSPEIFERAAARVNVRPERILYAGDHPDLDLWPAREVGFEAFLVQRPDGRARALEGVPEARMVTSLTELIERLPG